MSRLTSLFGAHKNQLDITWTGYYVTNSTGGAGTDGIGDVDGIGYKNIQYNKLSGQGTNRRSVGQMNFQAFVDPTKNDATLQLRTQDLVQVGVIDGGGEVSASIGFFKLANWKEIGCFWFRDPDGVWCSMLTDTIRGQIYPARTLRRIRHTGLISSVPHLLGLIIDGKTKTIYWTAENEVVDFFTPNIPIAGANGVQSWCAKIGVIDDNARLYFHGGGDRYTLALGDFDASDLWVGEIVTPVISVSDSGSIWVQLAGTTYQHNADETHLASKWEITLDADSGFETPGISYWSCKNLTTLIQTGLTPETDYRARVKYAGEDGTQSDWSDAVQFTTLAEGEVPEGDWSDEDLDSMTVWSNTGAVCEEGEDVPSTPWEGPGC